MIEELPLSYHYIPSSIPSKKVTVVLHGRGDSHEGFLWLPETLGFDDMNYVLLNAPFEWYGGRSWYDLPPRQLEGIRYSRGLLAKTFDKLFEKTFDPAHSFLFGFSQGALLTFEFGARYERKLCGYIAVSGYIYDTKRLIDEMNPALKDANWLCTHGIYDDVLAFETTKKQIDELIEGGMDIKFVAYDKAHQIIDEETEYIRRWMADKFNR
jgi:phospholipase/carboxylesterase